MKFTLSWLKEYLDTSASLNEICEKLTAIGLEVESVENKAKDLEFFTVAEIIDAKPHESSTKLKVCQVQTADSTTPLQIVCGASNARAGIKVAYAPIGSIIPANKMQIKKAKIAGVESNGMLCSARELSLGNEDAGIIEIAEKWPVGTKIAEVYNQNEVVIEINVTPNRGDCLGIYGIARDLSASGIGTLKTFNIEKISGQFEQTIKTENLANELCSKIAFRLVKNVKNCASPQWLKDKLEAVGINSISAIVDITNYVMVCLNRPMHAYDASKIKAPLQVRLANNSEKFTSLKNEEFILNEKILTISDQEKVLGIAGVIGSKNSAVELETTDILLESAFFSPQAVAFAGRNLNILSDARYRFERGIDIKSCENGIDLASKLIAEICGGEFSEINILSHKDGEAKIINFDPNLISKITGIEISANQAVETLNKLGFASKILDEKNYAISVPSYRHDISIAQDLVEEIVRICGYENIKSQKLSDSNTSKTNVNKLDKARKVLSAKGMSETINWSFIDEKLVEIFAEKNDKLILQNPISSEMNHMRPSLIPGLLASYQRNCARQFSDLSIFEIGNIFSESNQKMMLSGLRSGKNSDQNHFGEIREFDVFDVKKDLLDVIEIFGLRPESLQIDSSNPVKYYHPHRFAELKIGKSTVGYFGELNPRIAKKFDLKNRVNIFEIFVDNLPQQSKPSSIKAFEASSLQAVERDFAFLVDEEKAVGEMLKTIQNVDKNLISEVNVFDIFQGKNIEVGKKSVAINVKIQPNEKTLTSEEIELISQKIIAAVDKFYGAKLRQS